MKNSTLLLVLCFGYWQNLALAETLIDNSTGLSPFHTLEVSRGVDVRFTQNTQISSTIELFKGDGNDLHMEVVDGVLVIKFLSTPQKNSELLVKISAPAPSTIRVLEGATLAVDRFDGANLTVDVDSGGTLDLSGRCHSVDVYAGQDASVNAQSLQCKTVEVLSKGNASVNFSETSSNQIWVSKTHATDKS